MQKLRDLILLLVGSRDVTRAIPGSCSQRRVEHYRDSHIEPDWLLIYKVVGDELHLVRTGSHSDLFE